MTVIINILKLFIFPGFAFLGIYSMALEFFDRKLYARLQNRKGPPWHQPLADFFKLMGKETIIPEEANILMFKGVPLFALASVAAAFVYIPVWGDEAMFSFEGDMVITLYFLAIPSMATFLAGWYSRSVYATVGSTRVLTQMFAYEVPMFMALLAPTLLSGTWSISENMKFYTDHPALMLVNIPAMVVTLVAIQCKLERTPFDAPEAETEIVSGPLVEYGGRYLALFKMSRDWEMTVVISLFAAVFLPYTTGIGIVDFMLYIIKTLIVLFLLCLMKASTARLRINQIVSFCWKYLTTTAILQILLNLALRGVLLK